MRVLQPRISTDNDEVVVSAEVEVDGANLEFPNKMWFAFPREYRESVSHRLDGFAASLLPLAMTLGEDLNLHGTLSTRLFRGLEEYQRLQCAWKPTSYRPVRIEADELRSAERNSVTSGVGASFSGGVDSFYTLWRHLEANEPLPDYRVTHCLLINGFDADSDTEHGGRFKKVAGSIEPVLSSLGVRMLMCRTNYMSFSDPDILKHSFGAMVTVPALILGDMFSYFLIPASYRFNEFFRDGSHLVLDHLVSTESMQTVHDSSHLMRPEKTAVIADWEPTYSALRVCFGQTGYDEETRTILNCGRCEKCIRTMKTLEIFGRRERFRTFARRPSHLDVWTCYYGDAGARLHAREILLQAWRARKFGIWADYCIAIAVSFAIKIPRDVFRRAHLAMEERSEWYASTIRRLWPRLRRRAYWIRPSATRAGRPEPTSKPRRDRQ